MVWVEQPLGTGFTQGTPTATNEAEVAAQFLGFFKNFVDTFAMEGYTVYSKHVVFYYYISALASSSFSKLLNSVLLVAWNFRKVTSHLFLGDDAPGHHFQSRIYVYMLINDRSNR